MLDIYVQKKNIRCLTLPFWLVNSLWVGTTLDYYYLGTLGYEGIHQKEMYRKMAERSRE